MPSNDRFIQYALGTSANLARVSNMSEPWSNFRARFSSPMRQDIAHADYLALPTDEKLKLKAAPGFFMGAPVKGGWRRKENIEPRCLITLDIDENGEELLAELLAGLSPLSRYEFILHTTRGHTPDNPKFRLIIPTIGALITAEEYNPVSRIVAAELVDPSMASIDPVSHRPAQMMFLPSASADQEFIYHHNDTGEFLDWREATRPFVEKHGGLFVFDALPRNVARETQVRDERAKAGDPYTKPGDVGAFNRFIGDIRNAIDRYLSDFYEPSDNDPNRYTWVGGSSANGVVIYDDKFLYSFHSTDPCAGQLCNAFDAVRLCLFGGRDAPKDEALPVNQRPSYRAMLKWLKENEEYQRFLVQEAFPAPQSDDTSSQVSAIADGVNVSQRPSMGEIGYIEPTMVHFLAWRRGGFLHGTPFITEDGVLRDDMDDAADAYAGMAAVSGDGLGMTALEREWWGHYFKRRYPRQVERYWPSQHEWFDQLEMAKRNGRAAVAPTDANLKLIVENDPRFHVGEGLFADDAALGILWLVRPVYGLDGRIVVDAPIPLFDEVMEKFVYAALHSILAARPEDGGYGLTVGADRVRRALLAAWPVPRSIDSMRNWITDEERPLAPRERLDEWLADYLRVDNDAYHSGLGRALITAMAARISGAETTFAIMPVLVGEQGCGKSTFVRLLAMDSVFFRELPADAIENDRKLHEMAGSIAVEESELETMRTRRIEALKRFLSMSSVKSRAAYARNETERTIRFVTVGTTNEYAFLNDPTGERRFWPVEVGIEAFVEGKELDTQRMQDEMPALLRRAWREWQKDGAPRMITPPIEAIEAQKKVAERFVDDTPAAYDAQAVDEAMMRQLTFEDVKLRENAEDVLQFERVFKRLFPDESLGACLFMRAFIPSRDLAEEVFGKNEINKQGWPLRLKQALRWAEIATTDGRDFLDMTFGQVASNRMRRKKRRMRVVGNRLLIDMPDKVKEFALHTWWFPVLGARGSGDVDNFGEAFDGLL